MGLATWQAVGVQATYQYDLPGIRYQVLYRARRAQGVTSTIQRINCNSHTKYGRYPVTTHTHDHARKHSQLFRCSRFEIADCDPRALGAGPPPIRKRCRTLARLLLCTINYLITRVKVTKMKDDATLLAWLLFNTGSAVLLLCCYRRPVHEDHS